MKKKLLVLAIACAAFSFSAMAQNGHGNNQHQAPTPEQITERLNKELNLSEDQKAKVLDLTKEYADVFAHHGGPKHEGGQMSDQEKNEMKARKAQRAEYQDKVKALLTAEQAAKYEEISKHDQHGNGHANGHYKDGHGNGNANGHNKDGHGNGNANGHNKEKSNNGNANGHNKEKSNNGKNK
ncbi:MAG: DUF4890 domain-containing protein [Bacteroidales bacterium]|nr:DUF4890 domain-containing protein [Bacteroidales bacterium]